MDSVQEPTPIPSALIKPVLAGAFEPGYFLVRYTSPPNASDRALLDIVTGPIRRADKSQLHRWYVPDNTLVAWVADGRTYSILQRAAGVDRIERYQPVHKLDAELMQLALDPTRAGALRLNLDLVPGHRADQVATEVTKIGARVLEPVQLRGSRGFDVHYLVVDAHGSQLVELAHIEGVRTILAHGGDLRSYDPLQTPRGFDPATCYAGSLAESNWSGVWPGQDVRWLYASLIELAEANVCATDCAQGPEEPLGSYSIRAQLHDLVAFEAADLLQCLSAGELGDSTQLASQAAAKNALVVGRGADAQALQRFDGAQKPDLVGASSSDLTAQKAAQIAGRLHTALELENGTASKPSSALLRGLLVHANESSLGELDSTLAPLFTGGPSSSAEAAETESQAPNLLVYDIRSKTGFAQANDPADVRSLQVGGGRPLHVTLAWIDEPAAPGRGKKLINDLDLQLIAPDGSLHRGGATPHQANQAVDRTNNLETVWIADPLPGEWTVRVVPGPGNYADGQGYALIATGDVIESQTIENVVETTATLTLASAFYTRDGLLGQAAMNPLRNSDNSRFRVRDGESLSMSFSSSVPPGATLTAVRIFVEHHEDQVQPGDIVLGIGSGSLTNPTINAVRTLTLRNGPGAETIDSWAPTTVPGAVSDLRVQVENRGGDGDSFLDWVRVEVDYLTSNPTAPVITSTPNLSASVGAAYTYDDDGRAQASGQAPISWSVNGPAGMTVVASTGQISWTPTGAGSFPVTLRATNSLGSDLQSFSIAVSTASQAPVITSSPNIAAEVGQAYAYDADRQAEATGTDPLSWSVVSGPPGFTIQPTSGLVSWTPTGSGTETVTLGVSNAAGSDTQTFIVSVTNPNGPAVIRSTPNLTAHVGIPYLYDADGRAEADGLGPVTWRTKPNSPAGFSIDAATGVITWTPTATGTYALAIRATNSLGVSTQPFTVSVSSTPIVAPTITSIAGTSAQLGQTYLYSAQSSGTQPIQWSLASGPAGASIDDAGVLSWTPSSIGTFPFRIVASNAAGSAEQAFTVDIVTLPSPVRPSNASPITYCPPERLALGNPWPQQHLNVFLPLGQAPAGGWPVLLVTGAGGARAVLPQTAIADTSSYHDLLGGGIAIVSMGNIGVRQGRGLFFPPGHPRYESFAPLDDSPEKDMEWAIQWLKTQSNYPFDLERIGLAGSSQGAAMALWAGMGPDRARGTGSTQVQTSTRVKAIVAYHPPTSVWAYDQSPQFGANLIAHFEQATRPGVPATSLGQVDEALQKEASAMRYAFATPEAASHNETQRLCLIFNEPLELARPNFSLDASGFPLLHNALGQRFLHDSWFGYAFFGRLLELSPEAAAFHRANSVFAVRDTSALGAPNDIHTHTYSGLLRGPESTALVNQWVLSRL